VSSDLFFCGCLCEQETAGFPVLVHGLLDRQEEPRSPRSLIDDDPIGKTGHEPLRKSVALDPVVTTSTSRSSPPSMSSFSAFCHPSMPVISSMNSRRTGEAVL
jgi:hypothetical protein